MLLQLGLYQGSSYRVVTLLRLVQMPVTRVKDLMLLRLVHAQGVLDKHINRLLSGLVQVLLYKV